MRNPTEVDQFIDSLNLSRNLSPKKTGELQDGHTVFELFYQLFLTNNPSQVSMQRFARFGLVFGYGDSFTYDQQGFVIIGGPGVGKTPTIKELKKAQPERIEILDPSDCVLMSQVDEKLQLHTFPDMLAGRNWQEVVRNCVNYIYNDVGFPLNGVVYMDEDRTIKPGFMERKKKYPPRLSLDYLFGVDRSFLGKINFLYYNNNRTHSLPKVAQDILERLDQITR